MIEWNAMNKKKSALYECMWGSKEFDFPVEKTVYKGKVTDNSYTFANTANTTEDGCRDVLADLFGIKEKEVFRSKFKQSISGSGQELKRIGTMHSSSLCALLFFYNVTEDNPYIMEIDGEEYVFTYSCFEYQNTVIKGRNPSNMDVVLVGKHNKSGKIVVFFLESKFSEYYERTGKQLEIAAAYLQNIYGKFIYRDAGIAKMGFEVVEEKENKNFILRSDENCYMEGIKQMISHYIGVRNLCDKPDAKDDIVANAVSKGAKVLLGEILFTKGIGQLPIDDNGEGCFEAYQKKYRVLAKVLNDQLTKDGMSDRITVLHDILSYSGFRDKEYVCEERVKKFYFESGKCEKS